jgi:hypothetical protein
MSDKMPKEKYSVKYCPIYQCPVKLLSTSRHSESHPEIKVDYNFPNEVANLRILLKPSLKLKEVKIKYHFTNETADETQFWQLENGQYTLDVKKFNRHVLHQKFLCRTLYIQTKNPQTHFISDFEFEIPYFQEETNLVNEHFESYFIPTNFIELFENDFQSDGLNDDQKRFRQQIKEESRNHWLKLKYGAMTERLENIRQKYIHRQNYVKVRFIEFNIETNQNHYSIVVNESVMPEDLLNTSLVFIEMRRNGDCQNKIYQTSVRFYIDEVNVTNHVAEIIFHQPKGKIVPILNNEEVYQVRFYENDFEFVASLSALDGLREKDLLPHFMSFNTNPRFNKPAKNLPASILKFENENIGKNIEQSIVTRNIVGRTSFPSPYVVVGPPGTGKTTTIVESIIQIMKMKPSIKIFVSSASNSACNEIGERLLDSGVDIRNIFRYYANRLEKCKPESLSQKLKISSNLTINRPITKEEFCSFKIVISTLSTSAHFDRKLLSKHFDYIFIDECAATTELEALIPIERLGCGTQKINSMIVLAGDSKQLPPVVKSEEAKNKFKFNVSLLERMLATSPYREGDEKFSQMLRDNFRSHKSILKFSSETFYDGQLRAKSEGHEINCGLNWKDWTRNHHPIVFINMVQTQCNQDIYKSSFNNDEVEKVVQIVDDLLKNGLPNRQVTNDDIGIISPYKSQVNKIKEKLGAEIKVGTVEDFQGKEKLIIVISTVKSACKLGFIKDERRLNVMLTRAKALLIIVGNGMTLKVKFNLFIDFFSSNSKFL